MGIGLGRGSMSGSRYDCNSTNVNPDPKNYTILQAEQQGRFLILKLKYSGCTNYEGTKILVYKDVSLIDLVNQKSIDPHFCNNSKFHSPIARFIPTNEGWNMAETLCRGLS